MRIENWRKAQKCFVAATFFLLCSLHAAGQEPVDSVPAITDSMVMISSPDTIAVKSDPPDMADTDFIYISDTVAMENIFPIDSLALETYAQHSPAKAAIMSAVLPGLGQMYNRKYWKVPVVYVAVGVSSYIFLKWQNEYNRYRRAYIDIKDNDPYTNFFNTLGFPPTYTNEQKDQYITKRKEQLRTWRDWSIIALVATYALNIIDANVDAHLMGFNLDDILSLNIRPCFLKNGINSQKFGLTLQLAF